jgi:hypothetical protein
MAVKSEVSEYTLLEGVTSTTRVDKEVHGSGWKTEPSSSEAETASITQLSSIPGIAWNRETVKWQSAAREEEELTHEVSR